MQAHRTAGTPDPESDAREIEADDRADMRTVRYITGVPRKPLPPGHVVVHNHVLPVGGCGALGVDGFRAWIAAPADDPRIRRDSRDLKPYNVVRCDCGWRASELPVHYRVRCDDK